MRATRHKAGNRISQVLLFYFHKSEDSYYYLKVTSTHIYTAQKESIWQREKGNFLFLRKVRENLSLGKWWLLHALYILLYQKWVSDVNGERIKRVPFDYSLLHRRSWILSWNQFQLKIELTMYFNFIEAYFCWWLQSVEYLTVTIFYGYKLRNKNEAHIRSILV